MQIVFKLLYLLWHVYFQSYQNIVLLNKKYVKKYFSILYS